MKNILVFPCGSEIGLEIHRSIRYSAHFNLIGASSVKDHGCFIYENYLGGIPFHDDINFIEVIKSLVEAYSIDAIYPAMDEVAVTFKKNESDLNCRVIGSSYEFTSICASKKETYKALDGEVPIPIWNDSIGLIPEYPVFVKPAIGYGSRNTYLAHDKLSAEWFVDGVGKESDFVFCEYLSGAEYTVDCFSNRHGELLFCGARERVRVSNGVSVNTRVTLEFRGEFELYAYKINKKMLPQGAWFFQMKKGKDGKLKLLEVAARLAGSSSLFRNQGVNFALLSVFDSFCTDVSIVVNDCIPELDRALGNRYKLNIDYSVVYVDYDDCILIDGRLNWQLMKYIFYVINNGKKVVLITRHTGNIWQSLREKRISEVFDEVLCVNGDESKSAYIKPMGAIFIDDSHAERMDVKSIHGIPVFSPDMVEALLPPG